MKTRLLIFLNFFVLTGLYAQKVEISFQASSGAYYYSGASATNVSWFNSTGTGDGYYTNNVYGSKAGFSYGAAIQAQYISKGGFITGLQAGYDVLRSRQDIDKVYPLYFDNQYQTFTFAQQYVATKGEAFLQSQSINLSPYIGYRIKAKKINLDLMPGFDIAFNLSSYDKGKATGEDGIIYRTNLKRPDAPTDVRLKFGVAAGYKKWGITAGYAHGLTNMEKDIIGDGGPYIAHSELFRFGISYIL